MKRLRSAVKDTMLKLLPTRAYSEFIHSARWFVREIEQIQLYGGRDIPVIVEIETNSTCTKDCPYCVVQYNNRGTMERDVFFNLIDQLNDWGFKGLVSPNGYNEPLTDPNILDYLAYVCKSLPSSGIRLYTNGDLLESRISNLLDVPNLELWISLHDGITPKQEELFTQYSHQHHQVKLEERRTGKRKVPLSNRGGKLDFDVIRPVKLCYETAKLIIHANGNVPICCHDGYEKVVIGNIHEQSLQDIYYNPEFVALRKRLRYHRDKTHPTIPDICRKCGYEVLK